MRQRSDVAVVIPTRNGGADLAALLNAVDCQDGPFHPRIVAIDSGSTDGTLALLAGRGATVLRIAPAAFNHGETRNEALRAVETEFAVLIVQDALPASTRWLEALVRPLCEDPSLAGTWARQRPRADASRLTAFYLSQWAGAQTDGRVAGPVDEVALAAMTPTERHRLCAFDNVSSCIRMSGRPRRPARACQHRRQGVGPHRAHRPAIPFLGTPPAPRDRRRAGRFAGRDDGQAARL